MIVAAAATAVFVISITALSRAGGDLARHGEFLQLHHFYYGLPLLLLARRRRWYWRAAVIAGLLLMVDDAGQHLAQWQTGDPFLRSPVHKLYARFIWQPLFGVDHRGSVDYVFDTAVTPTCPACREALHATTVEALPAMPRKPHAPPERIQRWILVISGVTALIVQLVQLVAAVRLLLAGL